MVLVALRFQFSVVRVANSRATYRTVSQFHFLGFSCVLLTLLDCNLYVNQRVVIVWCLCYLKLDSHIFKVTLLGFRYLPCWTWICRAIYKKLGHNKSWWGLHQILLNTFFKFLWAFYGKYSMKVPSSLRLRVRFLRFEALTLEFLVFRKKIDFGKATRNNFSFWG